MGCNASKAATAKGVVDGSKKGMEETVDEKSASVAKPMPVPQHIPVPQHVDYHFVRTYVNAPDQSEVQHVTRLALDDGREDVPEQRFVPQYPPHEIRAEDGYQHHYQPRPQVIREGPPQMQPYHEEDAYQSRRYQRGAYERDPYQEVPYQRETPLGRTVVRFEKPDNSDDQYAKMLRSTCGTCAPMTNSTAPKEKMYSVYRSSPRIVEHMKTGGSRYKQKATAPVYHLQKQPVAYHDEFKQHPIAYHDQVKMEAVYNRAPKAVVHTTRRGGY